jgi:hypothetical protein
LFEGVDDVYRGVGWHGDGVYGVAVIIVENKYDIFTSVGGNGEPSSLVGVNEAALRSKVCVGWWLGYWKQVSGRFWSCVCVEGDVALGELDILPTLVEVSFNHGWRGRWIGT